MQYEQTLTRLMHVHEDLFVLTAENKGPCIHVGEHFPHRYVDCGIAEQTMVGAAAGLASRGRHPVIHAMAAFLTMRAFEFIRSDIGTLSLPVTLVGTSPGFLSEGNGPTHQAIEDVALMRSIPTMNVFCPADNDDLVMGLEYVLRDSRPWYVRHNPSPACVSHAPFLPGRAEQFGDGRHAAILCSGLLLAEALDAQARLAARGVAVRVLNLRSIRPLDVDAVMAAATECATLFTLEDHLCVGGAFSAVCELLAGIGVGARVTPLGLHAPFPAAPRAIAAARCGLDAAGIEAAVISGLKLEGK